MESVGYVVMAGQIHAITSYRLCWVGPMIRAIFGQHTEHVTVPKDRKSSEADGLKTLRQRLFLL